MIKQKKLCTLILTLVLLFTPIMPSPPLALAQNTEIQVVLDGKTLSFQMPPMIQNGRTLVPMRTIFEELGFTVTWHESSKSIKGIKNGLEILLQIGNKSAYKNDIIFPLDTAPELIHGITYVPLRFLAESTGAAVLWDDSSNRVIIQTDSTEISNNTLSDSVVMLLTDKIQGSGVILSSDGYLVTNYHVINGATKITVVFNNTDIYTGEVLVAGYDIGRDLAILKINKNGLSPSEIAENTYVRLGEEVTAIGSPLGIINTVTTGVVESVDVNLIATTAKIDQGSSGGGLFNQDGKLIGIMSSYSDRNDYFAIPISYAESLDRSSALTLLETSQIQIVPAIPKNFIVSYSGKSASVNWEPQYGVDYYRIYQSTQIDGEYQPVYHSKAGGNEWYWGYPHSFAISATEPLVIYLKVSAVRNGIETGLSKPIELNIQ